VAGDAVALEPLHRVGQAVRQLIDVGVVDLVGVAREDHLRALAGPREHGLDLVRREVLRLVDDEELLAGSSARGCR
jgi:hypothetical protein